MSTNVSVVADTSAVRVALVISLLSLLLSGWAVLDDLGDAERDRAVQTRLECLERPGPNDCGLDEP
jgi:hypothetical protein